MDFSKIITQIDSYLEQSASTLPSAQEGMQPIEISIDKFKTLPLFGSDQELTAIDGGSTELLNGSSFSLHLLRIAAVTYNKTKKVKQTVKECSCFVQAQEDHYTISFEGESLLDPFSIPKKIQTLDLETYTLDIENVIHYVRRYAELVLAASFDSCIVMDGSLQVKTKQELDYLTPLLKKNIGFLSKTCRLLTKTGSLPSTLLELGPKGSWYYHPVYDISRSSYPGAMSFARLHPQASYVFELGAASLSEEYIYTLSQYCGDPTFYGYPYPLIAADQLARISNEEKEYYKTKILSSIKNKDKLRYALSSQDAHGILDTIRY